MKKILFKWFYKDIIKQINQTIEQKNNRIKNLEAILSELRQQLSKYERI